MKIPLDVMSYECDENADFLGFFDRAAGVFTSDTCIGLAESIYERNRSQTSAW